MAGFYEAWFQSPGFGPNWMHDPVGDAYWGAIGKVFDDQVGRMKRGLRARFPDGAATAGLVDALYQIGEDRMLPRGGSSPGADDESLPSWAARLKGAWISWALAGSAQGLLLELKSLGFPTGVTGASVFNHIGRRYYLDDSGALVVSDPCMNCENRTDLHGTVPTPLLQGFTLDARDQFYSGFCVLFLSDVPSLTNEQGNVAKASLNQAARRLRQAGAHYLGAAVVPHENSAKVLGWPATIAFGDSGLVFGANGSRYIDPE